MSENVHTQTVDGGEISPNAPQSLVDTTMVKGHLAMAMTWLALALIAGLLYSLQLLQSWPLPKLEFLSPGRIRLIHTNLIAFGFLKC